MSKTTDPTKPLPDGEKFKPQHVTGETNDPGRNEREMENVSHGSEGDRRRAAQNRI